MDPIVIFIILAAGAIIIGSICGIIALASNNENNNKVEALRDENRTLKRGLSELQYRMTVTIARIDTLQNITTDETPPQAPPADDKISEAPLPFGPPPPPIINPTPQTPTPQTPASQTPTPRISKPANDEPIAIETFSPEPTSDPTDSPPPTSPLPTRVEALAQIQNKLTQAITPALKNTHTDSFEFKLGSRWGAWLGAILFMIGVGLGIKYAFDRELISETMRITLGALLGVAMIAGGEVLRRRDWAVLFRVLTGAGLGVFYLCDFFAFEIYHLAGQTPAFITAICITLLGVSLAIKHNAMSIAILAVIGGFLSPVLLSTGANRPYELFIYILLLNLVAMGAAAYRRWNALNALCFVGTTILYQAWAMEYYDATQMTPALIFATLFYLLFLILPAMHSLLRGTPREMEGVSLLVGNALYSVWAYQTILLEDHRHILGLIVLTQATLVFALRYAWQIRLGSDNKTSQSLLVIGITLATLAVPIHLRAFGLPMIWALEAILLGYLAVQHNRHLLRAASAAVAALSFGALLYNLPLAPDLPRVFNPAFCAWMLATVSYFTLGAIFNRLASYRFFDLPIARAFNIAAIITVTLAVPIHFDHYTVPTLWTLIAGALAYSGWHFNRPILRQGGLVVTGLAVAALLKNMPVDRDTLTPVFNIPFATWFFVIASLFAQGTAWYRLGKNISDPSIALGINIAALALLAIAVPVHFTGYTTPILWASLSLGFAYLGNHLQRIEFRNASAIGAMLAALGLLQLAPLHDETFTPLFNLHAGAWLLVIATTITQAYTHWHFRPPLQNDSDETAPPTSPLTTLRNQANQLIATNALLAYALTCLLLTFEVYYHWDLNLIHAPGWWLFNAQLALWTGIGALTVYATQRYHTALGGAAATAEILSAFALGLGALIFCGSLIEHDQPTTLLFLNISTLIKAAFTATLIWSATAMRSFKLIRWAKPLEILAHIMIALLLATELDRWQWANDGAINPTLGLALLSAAWALQAVSLIGWGLSSQQKLRRILGFALFGITLIKVIAIDTAELNRAMQVISFLASGVLLIVSAAIYQKFRALFEPKGPTNQDREDNEDDQVTTSTE